MDVLYPTIGVILFAIVLGLGSILFTAWIFSIVFRVRKQIELQKIQIKLLYKMAEHSGIDKAELNNIVKNYGDMIALPIT